VFRTTTSQAETFEHEMVMRFNCRFSEHAKENTPFNKRNTTNNMCRNNQTDPRRNGEGLFKKSSDQMVSEN
jgi:hypothetical protein